MTTYLADNAFAAIAGGIFILAYDSANYNRKYLSVLCYRELT